MPAVLVREYVWRTLGGAEAAVGEQGVEHLHGRDGHGVESTRNAVARLGLEVRVRRRVSASSGRVGRQRRLQFGLASAGVPNGCVRAAAAAIAGTRIRIRIRIRALLRRTLARVCTRRVCARTGGRRRLRRGTRVLSSVCTSRLRSGCGASGAVRTRGRGRRRRVECARRGARARRAPQTTGGGRLQREKVE